MSFQQFTNGIQNYIVTSQTYLKYFQNVFLNVSKIKIHVKIGYLYVDTVTLNRW